MCVHACVHVYAAHEMNTALRTCTYELAGFWLEHDIEKISTRKCCLDSKD